MKERYIFKERMTSEIDQERARERETDCVCVCMREIYICRNDTPERLSCKY